MILRRQILRRSPKRHPAQSGCKKSHPEDAWTIEEDMHRRKSVEHQRPILPSRKRQGVHTTTADFCTAPCRAPGRSAGAAGCDPINPEWVRAVRLGLARAAAYPRTFLRFPVELHRSSGKHAGWRLGPLPHPLFRPARSTGPFQGPTRTIPRLRESLPEPLCGSFNRPWSNPG